MIPPRPVPPTRMYWRQDEKRSSRYHLHRGDAVVGRIRRGDPEGATVEATVFGRELRLAWRGGVRRRLCIRAAAKPSLVAVYRPSWRLDGGGILALADMTEYRWHPGPTRAGIGHWSGHGIAATPLFADVSAAWNIVVEVTLPGGADTGDLASLLITVGGVLALTDALSRHDALVTG